MLMIVWANIMNWLSEPNQNFNCIQIIGMNSHTTSYKDALGLRAHTHKCIRVFFLEKKNTV